MINAPFAFSTACAQMGDSPINRLMAQALQRPQLLSLAAGFVDTRSLPAAAVQAASRQVLGGAHGRAALQYGTAQGNSQLRQTILDRIARQEGVAWAADVNAILLGSGSQQLLHLLCEALLNPGDTVVVESPTYLVFLDTLRRFGVRTHSIPLDGSGLDLDALETMLCAGRAAGELPPKFIYVVSPFQNPSGQSLHPSKYTRLLELAREFKVLVVEDGAYRELYYDQPHAALKSLDPEHEMVLHLGSFSKCFSPGLRVGYAAGHPKLLQAMLLLKGSHDFGSPHFNQCVLLELLQEGAVDSHVAQLRTNYKTRARVLHQALQNQRLDAQWSWNAPCGGIYLWAELPPGTQTHEHSEFFVRCLQHNILVVPGELCVAPDMEPSAIHHIRLSFGVCNEEELQEGARRLAGAWYGVG